MIFFFPNYFGTTILILVVFFIISEYMGLNFFFLQFNEGYDLHSVYFRKLRYKEYFNKKKKIPE